MILDQPPTSDIAQVIESDGEQRIIMNPEWREWFDKARKFKVDKIEDPTAGNLVTVDDDGNIADSTKDPPLGDILGTEDIQEVTNKIYSDLTASRIVSTNSDKNLDSVTDLTAWIAGTTGRITVTDDKDGTVTLQVPLKSNYGLSSDSDGLFILTYSSSGLSLGSSGIYIKVRPDHGLAVSSLGIYAITKTDGGLDVDANGLYAKEKANYGITIDANGIGLKKQSHEVDASTSHDVTGTDSVDQATLETALDDLGTKINNILAKLENAEVFASS